jgi:hypothetical protein
MFGGMSLADLASLLRAHGVDAAVHYADASTVEDLRAVLEANLGHEGDFLLVNYARDALGQAGFGHISPVAAYDRDTEQVLILDTARHKYPPTWVPVERLFAAMNTVDSSSGKKRGFVEVAPQAAGD